MDEEEVAVKGKKKGKEEVGDKKGADGGDPKAEGKKAPKVCVCVCVGELQSTQDGDLS